MTKQAEGRSLQQEHNKIHKITPKTVSRDVVKSISKLQQNIMNASKSKGKIKKNKTKKDVEAFEDEVRELESNMKNAAENLNFDKAILYRDRILLIQKELLKIKIKNKT